MTSAIQPRLLRRMTVRRVLELLVERGPSTRAALARVSGISMPTVSKAVVSLLESGFLEEEEEDPPPGTPGRPGTIVRLARDRAQVLGVVLDSARCTVVAAGLDGTIRPEGATIEFPTPGDYDALLAQIAEAAAGLMGRPGVRTLAAGMSIPGLINTRLGRAMFSPNLRITDGRSPDRDLSALLGIDCVMFQETQALCLGERMYSKPEALDDFVMLEISTGLGIGVVMDGRLLAGHSGLAGELGHVTVVPDGRLCGCGNRGCLETVATDSALARGVSESIGRDVDIREAKRLIREGRVEAERELRSACEYLAIAIAAAINLWNPTALFIHGQLFDARDGLFEHVCELAGRRALAPSFADCRIRRARWSKQQGAVAGAIHHLIGTHGPVVGE